jgi:sulfur-carrier protein adenylyltransferase/sulfurtransferase
MALSQNEILRYSRHLILSEVGVIGQEKLKNAKVLLIGGGGLGSPIAMYLAAAGVGTIGMVDFDKVDVSNLQRQILHGTSDVGKLKVDSAQSTLKEINPEVHFVPIRERLSSANVTRILKDYDLIVDGTDNFPTRYLVNDACVFAGKPFVYGSIFKFEGQVTVFYPGRGPCYRCLFAEPPPPGMVPSCAEGGVLGILPGLVGCAQATEAVKIILGKGELLIGRLLLYDALKMDFRTVKFRRNPKCPVCGDKPTITKLVDYEAFCGLTRGEEKSEADKNNMDTIEPKELKALIDKNDKVVILDVREQEEYDIAHLKGSKLIPLGVLPERVEELNADDDIVVHCHHGGRSARAIEILKTVGFKKLRNLTGGIDAWSEVVDSTCPRY